MIKDICLLGNIVEREGEPWFENLCVFPVKRKRAKMSENPSLHPSSSAPALMKQ